MKHIIVVVIVASFGVLADSALTKQQQAVEKQVASIQKVEQEYEHAAKARNASQLTHVLTEVKALQKTVKETRAEIEVHTESEHSGNSFYDRLVLETLHIRTGLFDETLKTIAQEILAEQNGIADFPVYQYSEQLETTKVLLTKKFVALLASTKQIDTIIATAAAKGAKLTAAEKTTIIKDLDESVKLSTSIHDELAASFATATETLHQEGKQLRLLQKMEIQSFIDEASFVLHFLKSFHELFLRIDQTA